MYVDVYPYIPQQTTRNCLRKSSVCVFFEIALGAPVLRAAPCSISSWELEFHWKKSPPVPTVGVMGVFCQNVWISTIFIPTQNGISVVLLNCHVDGCISIYIYDVCTSLKPSLILGCWFTNPK